MKKNKKIVVMIPAYNEEKNIDLVVKEIPNKIYGHIVKILVIDDGSTDKTGKVAKANGATKVVRNIHNLGLAKTFALGLNMAIEMGADIIVNTDADFQYNQKEIPNIVKPIIDGKADIVLTDRNIKGLKHMPFGKKYGNMLASFMTRFISGYPVRDAQSGFRAFSRKAAMKINVLSDYTYVAETIIQANYKDLKMVQVPCSFRKRNGDGKSRLIKNIFNYAFRAGLTILKTFTMYKPLKIFFATGSALGAIGLGFGLKVLIHFLNTGRVSPFIPTAILSAMVTIVGLQVIIMGIIADLIDRNRKLDEEKLYLLKKMYYNGVR